MGCVVFSVICAAHMVEDTLEEFSEGVWNMVVENVRPLDRVDFPALGICEFGDKEAEFAELFEHIERYIQLLLSKQKNNFQHYLNSHKLQMVMLVVSKTLNSQQTITTEKDRNDSLEL